MSSPVEYSESDALMLFWALRWIWCTGLDYL